MFFDDTGFAGAVKPNVEGGIGPLFVGILIDEPRWLNVDALSEIHRSARQLSVKGVFSTITSSLITIPYTRRTSGWLIAHELGHALGLADYDGCVRSGTDPDIINKDSIMVDSSNKTCHSTEPTPEFDFRDLSLIYGGKAREQMRIVARGVNPEVPELLFEPGAASQRNYYLDLGHVPGGVDATQAYALLYRELNSDEPAELLAVFSYKGLLALDYDAAELPTRLPSPR